MPVGYGVTKEKANATKAFNTKVRYMQAFRTAIAANSITPATLTLTSPGRFLLGITVIPTTAIFTTLGDTRITFVINNNNLVFQVPANNFNPNFVQGFIYIPVPQPLSGNDNITIQYDKQDAGTATVYCTLFYLPRV